MSNTVNDHIVTLKSTFNKESLPLEFWNNEAELQNYCNGILKHKGINSFVQVTFAAGAATAMTAYHGTVNLGTYNAPVIQARYEIRLPDIPNIILLDEESKMRLIYGRMMLLKHELAHVVHTDFPEYEKAAKNNQKHLEYLNIVEDTRIENLFSNEFKGNRRVFNTFSKLFFDKLSHEFIEFADLGSLFSYMAYREKGFKFPKNEVSEAFEKEYQQFKGFKEEPDAKKFYKRVSDLLERLSKEYPQMTQAEKEKQKEEKEKQKEEQQQNQKGQKGKQGEQGEQGKDKNKDQEKNDQQDSSGKGKDKNKDQEKNEITEDDSGEDYGGGENDHDNKSEESSDGEGNETEEENENSSGENSDDSDDQEESEEQESGSGSGEESESDDTEQEDGDSESGEEGGDGEDEGDSEGDSDSDSDQEGGNSSPDDSDVEAGKADDRFQENDNSNFSQSLNDSTSDIETDSDIENLLKDLSNPLDSTSLAEQASSGITVDDIDVKLKDMPSYLGVDYHAIFNCSSRKKYFNPNGTKVYNMLVAKHRKLINRAVAYLALKIQNKNRIKNLHFKQEGLLDQTNLKEIIIAQNDPRAFFKTIKKVENGTDFVLNFDLSGSMGMKITESFELMIIFIEILKRLNLNYEINCFGITRFAFKIDKDRMHLAKSLVAKNKNILKINTNNVIVLSEECNKKGGVFSAKLKSMHTPHTAQIEKMFGNIFSFRNAFMGSMFSGVTPEFQSFVETAKLHIKSRNKKVGILINDGSFNSVNLFDISKMSRPFCFRDQIANMASTGEEKLIRLVIQDLKNFSSKAGFQTRMKEYFPAIDLNGEISKLIEEIKSAKTDRAWDGYRAELKTPNAGIVLRFYKTSNYNSRLGKYEEQYMACDVSIFNGNAGYAKVVRELVGYYNETSYAVYKSLINNIRKNNYKIIGFGLNSPAGERYIGKNFFRNFKSMEDLTQNFVKRIMEVF